MIADPQLYRHLRVDRLDAVWYTTWQVMAGLALLIVVPSILSIIPARMNHTDRDEAAFSVICKPYTAVFRWIELTPLSDRLSHPVGLAILLVLVFHHAIRDRYAAVRQDLIDAEYVVEERVENYETQVDEPEVKTSEGTRDIGQNGFLVNVNNALERVASAKGEEQDSEWEDVDA